MKIIFDYKCKKIHIQPVNTVKYGYSSPASQKQQIDKLDYNLVSYSLMSNGSHKNRTDGVCFFEHYLYYTGDKIDYLDKFDVDSDSYVSKNGIQISEQGTFSSETDGFWFLGRDGSGALNGHNQSFNFTIETWSNNSDYDVGRGTTGYYKNNLGYIAPNYNGFKNQTASYDPIQDKYTILSNYNQSIYGVDYFSISDDTITGVGGRTSADNRSNYVNEYSITNNTWTSKSQLPADRSFGAASDYNNKGYQWNGSNDSTSTNTIFECDNYTWSTLLNTIYSSTDFGACSI